MTTAKTVRRQMVQGGVAGLLSTVVTTAVRLLVFPVLTRLISPEGHGQFAILVGTYEVLALAVVLGVPQAAIRSGEFSEQRAQGLCSGMLVVGLIAGAAACLSAPLVARWIEVDQMPVIAMGLSFGVNVAMTGPGAILLKDIRFAELAVFDAVATLARAAASVALAWALDLGLWALIAGEIAFGLVRHCLVLAATRTQLSLTRPFAGCRTLLRPGVFMLALRIGATAMGRAGVFAITGVAGAGAAGQFQKTNQLVGIVASNFQVIIGRMVMPATAVLRHQQGVILDSLAGFVIPWSLVSGFGAGMLVVFADTVVRLLFGSGWPSVPAMLQVLGTLVALQPVALVFRSVLEAIGDLRAVILVQVVALVLIVVGLAVGYHLSGLIGAAFGYLVAHIVYMLALGWLVATALRASLLSLAFRGLATHIVAFGLTAGLGSAVRYATTMAWNSPNVDMVALLLTACVYAAILALTWKWQPKELRRAAEASTRKIRGRLRR